MALRPAAECGVDIALGTVADHPACARAITRGGWKNLAVCRWGLFLRRSPTGREVTGKAGTFQLVSLLGVVAFGHEDEPVACGQLGQGLGHAGEQLNLLLGDGAGEAFKCAGAFRRSWARG